METEMEEASEREREKERERERMKKGQGMRPQSGTYGAFFPPSFLAAAARIKHGPRPASIQPRRRTATPTLPTGSAAAALHRPTDRPATGKSAPMRPARLAFLARFLFYLPVAHPLGQWSASASASASTVLADRVGGGGGERVGSCSGGSMVARLWPGRDQVVGDGRMACRSWGAGSKNSDAGCRHDYRFHMRAAAA